ncbi:MAG TPA: efflux RND transporter periplasmic adaptor subunit [Candidatus Elarobacter sp.]|jgi:multidrug efflux pump subunit AcrA (membrane-fusion protein)|nr:efflux RND transporter periplasmic adaptor subunit [Candidatus Elarobacter sp.]
MARFSGWFKRRPRAATASLVLAALATGCSHAQQPAQQASAAVVPVVGAQHGTVYPRTTLSGIIAPLQNVGITSTLAEPADTVNVKEGDHVSRGQTIAVLDTADLRAQLAQYQATVSSNAAKAMQTYDQAGLTIIQNSNTVNQARAMLRQSQQTLNTDTVNLQRYAQLVSQGYIPQQQYDQQATLVRNDQQAVNAARVTLQNDIQQVAANGTTSTGLQGSMVASAQAATQISQAQADQIRVAISKATIVSPIDGVVVNRNINPGEFPGTRQIFTLQETARVYAVLNGSAAQINGLRTGSTATILSSSLPGKQFTGKVDGVLNALNPGSTNFVVKVLLANSGGMLRPGMAVSGSARLPSTSGMLVPDTAFLDTTNSTVQTVSNGIVQTAHVTMLADDGKNAVVTGLTTGTPVVVNGQSGLVDGQTVQPQQIAQR